MIKIIIRILIISEAKRAVKTLIRLCCAGWSEFSLLAHASKDHFCLTWPTLVPYVLAGKVVILCVLLRVVLIQVFVFVCI